MAELSQLETALVNADKAGDTQAATTLAHEIKRMRSVGPTPASAFAKGNASSLIPDTPPQPKPQAPAMPSTVGDIEAAGAMATGTVGQAIGNVAGAASTITSGKFGTPQGIAEGAKTGQKVQDFLTYQPRTQAGQERTQQVGDIIDATKVAGLNPSMAVGDLAPAAGSARVGDILKRAPKAEESTMAGVGSAETDAARVRQERAGALPVPLKLTKGQATRDSDQLRFERETAKSEKFGKTLRERQSEQVQAIGANFDNWIDQTGAEAPTLRGAGQAVDRALVSKAERAKKAINAAYDEARANGEMAAPSPTSGVSAYLDKNVSAEGNSPILKSARLELDRLEQLAGGKGQLSINDMEELRKFIGENMADTGPDLKHGPELKKAIDAATEGAGGDLFKKARALRRKYAQEFEDRAIVSKLLDTKGKSADRAVAYEDVFKHSILNGSLDDVTHLKRTLQTEGEKGMQAWKELQGQTVAHLKNIASKSVQLDENGVRPISPAALDKEVRALDADGKLDAIFGKQGAQQIRDINDAAKDVLTTPAGVVNTSNTASVIMDALDGASHMTGIPVGRAMRAMNWLSDWKKSRALKRRVEESLQ